MHIVRFLPAKETGQQWKEKGWKRTKKVGLRRSQKKKKRTGLGRKEDSQENHRDEDRKQHLEHQEEIQASSSLKITAGKA